MPRRSLSHDGSHTRSRCVRIPDDTWNAAHATARTNRERLSDVVRRLLDEYIADQATYAVGYMKNDTPRLLSPYAGETFESEAEALAYAYEEDLDQHPSARLFKVQPASMVLPRAEDTE